MLLPYKEGLQWISEIHFSYILLYYIFMFPRNEDKWHPNISMHN